MQYLLNAFYTKARLAAQGLLPDTELLKKWFLQYYTEYFIAGIGKAELMRKNHSECPIKTL